MDARNQHFIVADRLPNYGTNGKPLIRTAQDTKFNINVKWLLEVATTVASKSKDPSTKVGALVVNPSNNAIIGMGYNGFARRLADTEERWERPAKYERVIHAEVNAIFNIRGANTEGCYVYCTHMPCHKCLACLVNAGIKRVYYYKHTTVNMKYEFDMIDELITECGIELYEYDVDTNTITQKFKTKP